MSRDGVPTPTLVCAIVHEHADDPGHVVYLQCEDPLTWTTDRKAAQVFADPVEAQRVAQENRAPSFFSYTVLARLPGEVAKTIPARHRRSAQVQELPPIHDWRADVPNAGVL